MPVVIWRITLVSTNVASGFVMLGFKSGVILPCCEQLCAELDSGRIRRFKVFGNSAVCLKRASCFEPSC